MPVQIFLSTVSAEFASYRDALRRDLDRPNVTVKVQEDFIATGTETLDKLDEYIRRCDAVIHLVGDMTGALAQPPSVAVLRKRYPNLAKQLPVLAPFLAPDAPPLSYTQWEAWLALYHAKVLIIAVPQDGAPRDELYRLDEAQRAVQQAHLTRLAEVERYPEIRFANADRLAVDVLRSKLQDIATPSLSSLHQLPRPPVDFTGRTVQLEELLSVVEQPHLTILLVWGMAGVGKTALVLKFAEDLGSGYPDAQIYLDLKGADRRPLTSHDALAHVVRSFHPTVSVLESEGVLRGLYLSVLRDKRVLILIDNAAGPEQLEALIPPKGCLLLATSRESFTLPGLYPKHIDPLPSKEAHRLLLGIAPRLDTVIPVLGGREEKAFEVIARLCGYLPLALRVAASAVSVRIDLSAGEYYQRLTERSQRVELVNASFSLSYDLLTPDLQLIWRSLSVFPDTFDRASAAAVWAMDRFSAADRLSDLQTRSLVEWNSASNRYHLHDLLRDYGDGRCTPNDRAEAKDRHASHYEDLVVAAQEAQPRREAIRLFSVELLNIHAAMDRIKERGEASRFARLTASLVPFYSFALSGSEAKQRFQEGAGAAHGVTDVRDEATCVCGLADVHRRLDEYPEAQSNYEKALNIYIDADDKRGQANCIRGLANTRRMLDKYRESRAFYGQALIIYTDISDKLGQATCLRGLGHVYRMLAQYDKAQEKYNDALTICRKIHDDEGEAHGIWGLGHVYLDLGDLQGAKDRYQEALRLCVENQDSLGEATCIRGLGHVHLDNGELNKAQAHYESAQRICSEIGDRLGEAHSIWGLAEVHLHHKQFPDAEALYRRALRDCRDIGDRMGEGHCTRGLGDLRRMLGNCPEARKLYRDARAI